MADEIVHRRPRLAADDLTVCDGIAVTTPIRTMVDIATILDARRLERAVNEADRLDLVDPPTLLAALTDYPGQRGVGPLRALLGDRVFRLTDSELERRFLRLVQLARLPLPLTRQNVNGYLVDFHWRFTHHEIRFEAAVVRATLERTIRRLRSRDDVPGYGVGAGCSISFGTWRHYPPASGFVRSGRAMASRTSRRRSPPPTRCG